MKITIIVLLSIKVSLIELNSTDQINKKLISNGEIYDPKKYPYVVTIESYDNDNFQWMCTGSLIKKLYVLTAAHCVYDTKKENIKIYSGSRINNQVIRKVVQLHLHHDFNRAIPGHAGDLSVLKLDKSFPNVKTFIEIGGDPKEFENHNSVECVSIGFGMINSDLDRGEIGYMMTTHVKHGEQECKGYYRPELKDTWYQFLCATPNTVMPCLGDDGGPMICNDKLYGVCSFFMNYEGGSIDCGTDDMQSVYVFLNYHLKWINKIVNKKKKRSAGTLLKPCHTLHMVLAILLYNVLISLRNLEHFLT